MAEESSGGRHPRTRASVSVMKTDRRMSAHQLPSSADRSLAVLAARRKSIPLCRPFQREDSRLAELAQLQLALLAAAAPARDDPADDKEQNLPFPDFVARAFFIFDQTTRPRNWCLTVISSPY